MSGHGPGHAQEAQKRPRSPSTSLVEQSAKRARSTEESGFIEGLVAIFSQFQPIKFKPSDAAEETIEARKLLRDQLTTYYAKHRVVCEPEVVLAKSVLSHLQWKVDDGVDLFELVLAGYKLTEKSTDVNWNYLARIMYLKKDSKNAFDLVCMRCKSKSERFHSFSANMLRSSKLADVWTERAGETTYDTDLIQDFQQYGPLLKSLCNKCYSFLNGRCGDYSTCTNCERAFQPGERITVTDAQLLELNVLSLLPAEYTAYCMNDSFFCKNCLPGPQSAISQAKQKVQVAIDLISQQPVEVHGVLNKALHLLLGDKPRPFLSSEINLYSGIQKKEELRKLSKSMQTIFVDGKLCSAYLVDNAKSIGLLYVPLRLTPLLDSKDGPFFLTSFSNMAVTIVNGMLEKEKLTLNPLKLMNLYRDYAKSMIIKSQELLDGGIDELKKAFDPGFVERAIKDIPQGIWGLAVLTTLGRNEQNRWKITNTDTQSYLTCEKWPFNPKACPSLDAESMTYDDKRVTIRRLFAVCMDVFTASRGAAVYPLHIALALYGRRHFNEDGNELLNRLGVLMSVSKTKRYVNSLRNIVDETASRDLMDKFVSNYADFFKTFGIDNLDHVEKFKNRGLGVNTTSHYTVGQTTVFENIENISKTEKSGGSENLNDMMRKFKSFEELDPGCGDIVDLFKQEVLFKAAMKFVDEDADFDLFSATKDVMEGSIHFKDQSLGKCQIVFLPITFIPATSEEGIIDILSSIRNRTDIGKTVDHVIIFADQQILQMLWKLKCPSPGEYNADYDWVLPYLGYLHTEMNSFTYLNKMYGPSLLDPLAISAAGWGTSPVSKSKWRLKLQHLAQIFCALTIYIWDLLKDEGNEEESSERAEESSEDLIQVALKVFKSEEFKKKLDLKCKGKDSENWQFHRNFLDHVSSVFCLHFAGRCSNLEMAKSALYEMTPMFFHQTKFITRNR